MKKISRISIGLSVFLSFQIQGHGQEVKGASARYSDEEIVEKGMVRLTTQTPQFLLLAKSSVLSKYYPRAIVGWKAPSQSLLLLLDPMDGTPLAAAVGGKTIFYDPFNEKLFTSDNGGLDCRVGVGDGQLNYRYTLPAHHRRIEMDLASLFRSVNKEVVVEMGKDGKYQVSGRSGDSRRSEATIDPRDRIPLNRLDIYSGNADPLFSFIVKSDPNILDDALFSFPSSSINRNSFPMEALKPTSVPPPVGLNTIFTSALRSAIYNPELRQDEAFLSDIAKVNPRIADILRNAKESYWNKMESFDARFSQRLRSAFSVQITRSGAGNGYEER